jgi:uncharacterized protein YlxP (DUF503 family)
VTIGVYTIELQLVEGRSLKSKRQVVRSIKARLRSRFNVAVVELDEHASVWQRSGLAIVSIAQNRDALERLFEAIHGEVAQHLPGHLVETGSDFFESSDGGPGGFSEDWR